MSALDGLSHVASKAERAVAVGPQQLLVPVAAPYVHEAALVQVAEVTERAALRVGSAARIEPTGGADPRLLAKKRAWPAGGEVLGRGFVEEEDVLEENPPSILE